MSYNPHNKIQFSKEKLKEIFLFYTTHQKKETAKEYNITVKVLNRLLKENGIESHSKVNITEEQELIICNLYKTQTSAYIGRLFHVKAERINKIVQKHNIPLHSDEENKQIQMANRKKTCLEKYGEDSPNKTLQVKEKIKNTNLEKYKTICPANTIESKNKQAQHKEEINKKRKETNLKKYGVEEYTRTQEYWERRRATCQKKYGADEWTKSDLFYQSFPGKFWCNNICFDSLPELAIYLYFIYHDLPIERPKTVFKYQSIDGEHIYHPDFKINEKLVEIKGDHFFNKEGILINPYSQEEKDQQIAKDKWQCMIENNVEVWKKEKYKKYVDWFYFMGFNKENFRDRKSKSDYKNEENKNEK